MADPKTPDSETPADRLTPHDPVERKPAAEPEPELPAGIVDPRRLPGPEILNPPPPGLVPPEEKKVPSRPEDGNE